MKHELAGAAMNRIVIDQSSAINRRSRLFTLLILGCAVAGWGCGLISSISDAQRREAAQAEQERQQALFQQFDRISAAQQGQPDPSILQNLYALLNSARKDPRCFSSCDDLVLRHQKLANWGYADSQYWLGRHFDPQPYSRNPNQASTARAWYEKAAAQGNQDALAALAKLDHAEKRYNMYQQLKQRFEAEKTPDAATQKELFEMAVELGKLDCDGPPQCRGMGVYFYQLKLAKYGYPDAEYWVGNAEDPSLQPRVIAGRQDYLQRANVARSWYQQAAAQGQPQAAAAIAHMDEMTPPEKP